MEDSGWSVITGEREASELVVRFSERGLATAYLTDPDIERLLLEDPLLMRTPVVRNGALATLGPAEPTWREWLQKIRRTGS